MMNSKAMDTVDFSDADLVAQSLAGRREAFGGIVARYQSLICSLIYSATGSLTQSEDLAQDTFITAWKDLANLREPAKLRPWLCQISRNLAFDALRKQGREPSHQAETLDAISESHSPDPSPVQRAISKEEQEILWRSIEHIPEIYREPLILFYREHHSVESVALKLDLTQDAVKQRLSRGRKLLSEQVVAFVEGALEQTNPGQAFTVGVLAALPTLTISAKAAMLGAAAAKGAASAKAAAATGVLGAILTPLLSFFGLWLGYRASVDTSRSEGERKFNQRFYRRLVGSIAGFFLVYLILVFCFRSLVTDNHLLFVALMIGLVHAYIIAVAVFSIEAYHLRRTLLANLTPEQSATMPTKPLWEFRSRQHLLGLPLVHIRIGDRLAEPIKAWIAAGDCAFGVLFAFGGLAIAPISIGGCAVGLFSFGGLSIGALSLGGCAVGIWVFGGLAMGWQAFGGCAIAWNAAWGGYAIARDFAIGGLVHAAQANNQMAIQVIQTNPFFRISGRTLPYLLWMNMIWVIPMMVSARVAKYGRRREKQNSQASTFSK
jgi:RNA polymerase sigma factor (sigma-70 family)